MGFLESGIDNAARVIWIVGVEAAFLIAVVWIVERLSHRTSSLFRYWLWIIVLVRLCIPVDVNPPENVKT